MSTEGSPANEALISGFATSEAFAAVQVFAHRLNGNWTIGLGDSNTDDTFGTKTPAVQTSPFEQACVLSGQVIARLDNAGVGGDKLENMLARLHAEVLSKRPDRVIFMGGTNNITSSLYSLGAMLATTRKIWDKITGHGIALAIVSVPPITSSDTVMQKTKDWNTLQAAEAAKRGIPYVDIYTPLSNGAGNWAAGMNRDALHFSAEGAMRAGGIIASTLASYWKPQSPVILAGEMGDVGNQLVNPRLADINTDGRPDSWNVLGTSGTIGVIADPSVNGNWVRLTRTTASGTYATSQVLKSGFMPGQTFEIAVKVKLAKSNPLTWTFYLNMSDARSAQTGIWRTAAFWTTDNGGKEMVLYGRVKIPANTTRLELVMHTSAGLGTIDWSQPVVRRIA
ncbi:SGNH/GDSL hydrolase family protein [Paeniglutamicibacter sp. ORCA_105]